MVKSVMNIYLGIQEYMIVDNVLSTRYESIKSINDLSDVNMNGKTILIASDDIEIYDEIRDALYSVVPKEQCVELFPIPSAFYLRKYPDFYKRYKESGAVTIRSNNGLRYHIDQQVLRESANYVLNHMNKDVRFFSNKFPLIEYLLEEKVDNSLGMFLEFGVGVGVSLNYIAALKPINTIYGFDSFEGLPDNWHEFGRNRGAFSLNGIMPDVLRNVKLVKGLFEESLPHFLNDHHESAAFIHIDCDIYSSAKTVFNLLKNRIVSGTVIQFDEYFNIPRWQENEYKAFHEFAKENNITYDYLGYVDQGSQVAIMIR